MPAGFGWEWSSEIHEQMRLAKLRERFRLSERWAVRTQDASRALLEEEPEIVHFSGHGTGAGEVCFEDEAGTSFPVPPDALAGLIRLSAQIRCVVLNACYSEAQALAIAEHVEYVVGMRHEIEGKAAVAFSVGFYQAVGAGRSYEEAFRFGRAQIRLRGLPDHLPVLHTKA